MKKLMMGLVIAGFISTSTFAETGSVDSITILDDGNIQVVVNQDGSLKYGNLVGNADTVKAMYAAALTAKTTNSNITVRFSGSGWDRLTIK